MSHLERLGLVERVRDQDDGRGVVVRPTRAANLGYESSRARLAGLEQEWRELVGQRRWRTFLAVLETVVRHEEGRVRNASLTPG